MKTLLLTITFFAFNIVLLAQSATEFKAFKAIEEGNISALKVIINHEDFDLNTRNADRITLLEFAIINNNSQMVAEILQAGPSLNIINQDLTLITAIAQENNEIFDMLIDYGVNPDPYCWSEYGSSLIASVLIKNDYAAFKLIDLGVDMDTKDKDGFTALHAAVFSENNELVKKILERKPDLEKELKSGHTPLMVAASIGNVEIINTLVEAGAKVNTQTGNWNVTPLHIAVQYEKPQAVEALIIAGANTKIKDNMSKAPLAYAQQAKNKEIIKMLINHKKIAKQKQ